MKDFLSDEEMAKLDNPDFISDEEMNKMQGYDYSNLGQVASDLVKTNVDALPAYGAAVGGLLGPMAAGAGSAAGESLKRGLYGVKELVTGERHLSDELRLPTKEQLGDIGMQQASAFTSGFGGEAAGRIANVGLQASGRAINKGFQNLANSVEVPTQKPNAEQITKAAKELGIDVTPAMLSDSKFLERLESSLAARPSMFGRSIARQQEGIQRGLKEATESTMSKANDMSAFQLGEKFKSDVVADVGQKLDPISALFDEVAQSTKSMPLNEKSLAAIQRNAGNLDMVQLGLGGARSQQYIEAIPKLKNVDQVKTLMSALNADYAAAQGAERAALGQIKDKLSRLEQNSIMRSAIEAARESGGSVRTKTGEAIGKELIGELKDARRGYRDISVGLQEVADTAKFGQKRMSPNQFLGNLEGMTSEQIPNRFFNVNDQRQLMALKERFPEQFEMLKNGKLGEIYQKSIDNSLMGQGEISTQRFLNAFRKLSPETQKVLFDENMGKIGNIEAVQQSLPRNFNPSGTSGQQSYFNILKSTVEDVPQYLTYKGASSNMAQKFGEQLKSPQMLQLKRDNPALFEQFVSRLTQKGLQFNEPEQKPNSSIDKNRILEKTQGSKYSQALQNAAQNGDKSFNAAHYVLSSQPEYRQMLEDEEQ
jgi:hypothetical protein